MQWKSNVKGVAGSISIYNRVLRLRHMNQEEVSKRIQIINFEAKCGTKATEEAFRVISGTIRRWKELL